MHTEPGLEGVQCMNPTRAQNKLSAIQSTCLHSSVVCAQGILKQHESSNQFSPIIRSLRGKDSRCWGEDNAAPALLGFLLTSVDGRELVC